MRRLAEEIRRDYAGKNPLLIGILKGCFVFMADLVRALDMPVEVDFVRISSYGLGKETSGKIKVLQPPSQPIKGRHVLVVEDIVDTGLTLSHFLNYLRQKRPASLKLCTFIDKRFRRQVPVPIDYVGIRIHSGFVVGYGTDFAEQYRYLSDVCVLEGGETRK